MLKPGCCFPQP